MKARNTVTSHHRLNIWQRWTVLLLCIIIPLSLLPLSLLTRAAEEKAAAEDEDVRQVSKPFLITNGEEDITNVDRSEAIHFIIRHWHTVEDPNEVETAYVEKDGEIVASTSVFVGGYIIPNGSGYDYYYRVYNTAFESNYSNTENADNLETHANFRKIDKGYKGPHGYIKIGDNNGKVYLPIDPYHVENEDHEIDYHEVFAGFSTSVGQAAVKAVYDPNDDPTEYAEYAANYGGTYPYLVIDPAMSTTVHIVKSHILYTNELMRGEGAEEIDISGDGTNTVNFPNYIDTFISDSSDSTKYYNTNDGLHTDKTASVNTSAKDNRTFDLDLEAWFVEGSPVNVGLILDASGSMGFTASTPDPIKVTNEQLAKIGNKKLTNSTQNLSDVFLSSDELAYAEIMNPHNTDNSQIRSSGYSYYIYDPRSSVQEFVPLGYWEGRYDRSSVDTKQGAALSVDGTSIIGAVTVDNVASTQAERKGWYYINPSGNWNENYANTDIKSGKTLNGILSGYTFRDTLSQNPAGVDAPFGGTNKTYTSSGASPMKFYVDTDGYLRCLYYINDKGVDNGYGASYVYKNPDASYIKVEALQRALASFITELEQKSPDSLISAVRFSTDKIPDNQLGKLVLSDWTANPIKAQDIMTNRRGNGGALDSSSSARSDFCNASGLGGIDQYNYGLTGSTDTVKGLKAFSENLDNRLTEYLRATNTTNSSKYIIVFTDGKDSTKEFEIKYKSNGEFDNGATANIIKGLAAYEEANNLKDKGYTIFCVLLAGGPVIRGTAEYEAAHLFLEMISGAGAGSKEEKRDEEWLKNNGPESEKPKYVYSTEDYTYIDGTDGQKTAHNTVDALIEAFNDTGGILDQITEDLADYTVHDYIDPRFDLVDAYGRVWHLNAKGEVTRTTADGKTVVDDPFKLTDQGRTIKLFDSSGVTETAKSAKLKYDSSKDMYYLEWKNQDVPCSNTGASKAVLWRARVTVRAKDDFIGGNAVMTNGNAGKQNYLYDPDGKSGTSSGIDKSSNTLDDPSRGFPRTTVNVAPKEDEVGGVQEIYMGEELSQPKVVERLIKNAEAQSEGSAEYYYWEYLERYVEYYNSLVKRKKGDDTVKLLPLPKQKENGEESWETIETDADGLLNIDELYSAIINGSLKLSYSYLPDAAGTKATNQTGGDEHRLDVLGYLTYSSKAKTGDGYAEYPDSDDKTTTDTLTRGSTLTVEYAPMPISDDESADDRIGANGTLVTEEDHGEQIYGWDEDYKEDVGDELTDENTPGITGEHDTNIVSGWVALQMKISSDTLEKIKNAANSGKIPNSLTLTYHADLCRDGKKIGDFNINIPFNALNASGDQFATAGITFLEEYEYQMKTYGLPLGTYTLVNGTGSTGSDAADLLFKFSNIGNIVLGDDDFNAERFKNTAEGIIDQTIVVSDFPATPDGDNGAMLGYKGKNGAVDTGVRFAQFQVTLDLAPTGNLTVSKTVEGDGGDTNKGFNFTVTLSNTSVNGTYGEGDTAMTFINGEATFTLKHGESKTATGLPAGINYKVAERNNVDYTVTETGASGTILAQQTAAAAFTNRRIPDPDLNIKKTQTVGVVTDDYIEVNAENIVTYTLTVMNNGEGDAEDVWVSDTITEGLTLVDGSIKVNGTDPDNNAWVDGRTITWHLGRLESKGTITVSFQVKVPELEKGKTSDSWPNIGYVIDYDGPNEKPDAPNPYDPDNPWTPSNEVVIEEKIPALEILKKQAVNAGAATVEKLEVNAKDEVTYYVTVTNNGKAAATEVIISDTIPAGLTLKTGSISDNGTFDNDNNTIKWEFAEIKAGGSKTVYFTVTVPSVAAITSWKNIAITSAENDPGDPNDNSNPNKDGPHIGRKPRTSNEVVIEEKIPALEILKKQAVNAGNATIEKLEVNAEDEVTYYVTVTNNGGADATEVIISDTIPAGLTLKTGSISDDGTFDDGSSTIIWKFAEIKAGGSKTVQFTVIVPSVSATTSWKNIAMTSAKNDPGDPNDNSNPNENGPHSGRKPRKSNEVEIEEKILALEILKKQAVNAGNATIEKLKVNAEDEVTYYVTVTNKGKVDATEVIISDTIPTGLTLKTGSISDNGTFDDDSNTIKWEFAEIKAGGSKTVQFTVTVPSVSATTSWKNIAMTSAENDPGDPNDNSNPNENGPHSGRKPRKSNEVEIQETIIVPGNDPQNPGDESQTPDDPNSPTPNTGDSVKWGLLVLYINVLSCCVIALVMAGLVMKRRAKK